MGDGGNPGDVDGQFLEDTVAVFIVVVPPFADTRWVEPSNKDHIVLGKLMLVKLKVNDKPETVPLELLRITLAIGKSTDCITYSPRSTEGGGS